MRRRIVLELLATAGCTFSGAKLWSGETAESPLPALSAARGAGRSVAESGVPAIAETRTPGAITEDAGVESAPPAGSANVAPRVDESSRADAPVASPTARRRPRAASSSIAPLPPLVAVAASGLPEVLARAALRLVGKDAAAEELWTEAINDLTLPEHARSDLIEDLNDEGFSDPDHLTASDLPLVVERLRIIERLAPRAADDVNAAAFEEAYKDLVGMWVHLRRAAPK